jgi:hypothetical protein
MASTGDAFSDRFGYSSGRQQKCAVGNQRRSIESRANRGTPLSGYPDPLTTLDRPSNHRRPDTHGDKSAKPRPPATPALSFVAAPVSSQTEGQNAQTEMRGTVLSVPFVPFGHHVTHDDDNLRAAGTSTSAAFASSEGSMRWANSWGRGLNLRVGRAPGCCVLRKNEGDRSPSSLLRLRFSRPFKE